MLYCTYENTRPSTTITPRPYFSQPPSTSCQGVGPEHLTPTNPPNHLCFRQKKYEVKTKPFPYLTCHLQPASPATFNLQPAAGCEILDSPHASRCLSTTYRLPLLVLGCRHLHRHDELSNKPRQHKLPLNLGCRNFERFLPGCVQH